MNEYVKGFLYGISLGTVAMSIFGAAFQVRELWVSLFFLAGGAAIAWFTYNYKDEK